MPDSSGRQIRHLSWQGKKASNPRPTVLDTAALPAELFPYTNILLSVRRDCAYTVQNPMYQNESELIRFGKEEGVKSCEAFAAMTEAE